VLVNTGKTPAALGLEDLRGRLPAGHLRTVPATELALKHIGRPIPSAALIAGFAALTGVVSLDAIVHALRERFSPSVAEANVAAASAAFDRVKGSDAC
jgi:pyruvate ferredoxin oxidoreductase gamma subunit